jgi:uncharacterized protein YndB with AHSA1/START domain
MKIALYVVGGLIAMVLVMVVIGYMLPVKHSASSERTVAGTPDQVYALISTPADFPKWRSDVKTVDMLPDVDGKPRFREDGTSGPILMEMIERVPGKRLVTRIADPDLAFGGTWTFELTPAASGTNVRITEDGEIYNPAFRFMARFVFGYTATQKGYLDALERRLGGPTA